jgi:hypothetical protein
VAGGHAARVAAHATVSGASITTTVAARCRKGRHGRERHEAGGNPMHYFHLRFPKVCLSASIVRTARARNAGQL